MRNVSPRTIPLALGAVVLLAVLLPPLAQPQAYHGFADDRVILGLPNALNVLSNLGFLLVGMIGLPLTRFQETAQIRRAYQLFFLTLIVVTAASACYHLSPNDARLLWDRLPIAVSLAALLSAVLAETGFSRRWTLTWLVFIGFSATLWWGMSPLWGAENLWPYLAFQAGCMVALLTLLPSLPAPRIFLVALLLYGTAVGAEWLDALIFGWTAELISGHTLKHLLASAAALLIALRLALQRAAH